MLYNSFLKNGIVYVPTVVKLQTGAYVDVEPVAVVLLRTRMLYAALS